MTVTKNTARATAAMVYKEIQVPKTEDQAVVEVTQEEAQQVKKAFFANILQELDGRGQKQVRTDASHRKLRQQRLRLLS